MQFLQLMQHRRILSHYAAWQHIIAICWSVIEPKPSLHIWSEMLLVFPSLSLLCYIALNPILHFPPTLHIFHTSLRVKLTFFCSLYLCFLYKVPSILWLVYETCAHSRDYLLLFPCISLLFFVSNRHSLDASDTIITYKGEKRWRQILANFICSLLAATVFWVHSAKAVRTRCWLWHLSAPFWDFAHYSSKCPLVQMTRKCDFRRSQ
jgi:hypothetical protein